jgi:hypothetical protein
VSIPPKNQEWKGAGSAKSYYYIWPSESQGFGSCLAGTLANCHMMYTRHQQTPTSGVGFCNFLIVCLQVLRSVHWKPPIEWDTYWIGDQQFGYGPRNVYEITHHPNPRRREHAYFNADSWTVTALMMCKFDCTPESSKL